jgi:hypothetical protein
MAATAPTFLVWCSLPSEWRPGDGIVGDGASGDGLWNRNRIIFALMQRKGQARVVAPRAYFPVPVVAHWRPSELYGAAQLIFLVSHMRWHDSVWEMSLWVLFQAVRARKRLVQGGVEQLLLDALLALCKEQGWLKARERQRTDSTHVLAKIRASNRLMCVGEALRFVRGSLAVVVPDWLLEQSEASWVERYGHRIEENRLPQSEADRLALAQLIGEDGWKVLTAVFDPLTPAFLREVPAVQVLRQIWVQNYWMEDGHLRWREADLIPPATLFINSPYDPQAHLGKKRSPLWTGYKVHLTQTCEHTLPRLIPHVATTPAPRTDETMTERIQEELHQAALAPGEHFVDAGYGSARVLVKSQERFGVEVVGPVSVDTQWQAHQPSGSDASQFVLDWEKRQATCPQGKTSTSWSWLSRKNHPDQGLGSSFPPRIVGCARVFVTGFSQRANTHAGRWSSDHRGSMPHFKLHASSSARKPSSRDMLFGQGLRPPFHKGCVPLTCAVLALWDQRKRMCSTSPSQRRSIWFALSIGLMATRSLLPAFRLLRGSTGQHEEFPNSVF